MDTGEGRFEMYDGILKAEEDRPRWPKAKGIFTVGEIIEIRGSSFRIKDISPFGIKLKLLK